MLEPCGEADLPLEALGAEGGGDLGMEDLERDGAVVSQVSREPDRGHALRRGGGQAPVTLNEEQAGTERGATLVALDEALHRLAAVDKRLSQVVECRYFGGLTEEETAEALGVSARTVERDWIKARSWLRLELGE